MKSAPKAGGSSTPDDLTNLIKSKGFFYPRWPVLAAIFVSFCTFIGLGIWIYYLYLPCTLGPLCHIDALPDWLIFTIIMLFFVFSWYIASLFVGYLEIPDTPKRRPITKHTIHFFRYISDFEPIRYLLIGFGGAIFLLIAGLIIIGRFRFQGLPDALAFMAICVSLCVLFRKIPRPASEPTDEQRQEEYLAQKRSPLYIFRSKWPIRVFWPNKEMIPPPATPVVSALPGGGSAFEE